MKQFRSLSELNAHFGCSGHDGRFSSVHLSSWARYFWTFLVKASDLLQVSSLAKLYEKVEPLLEGPAECTIWVTELARWFSCSVGVGESSAVRQPLSVQGSTAVLRAVDSGARFDLLRLERCQDLPSIHGRETFPLVF